MVNVENIYQTAIEHFKIVHPEWICTVERGKLVIQYNFIDGAYFSLTSATKEKRCYRHIITISEEGKFKATDGMVSNEFSVGLSGLQYEASAFAGYKAQQTTVITFGKKTREDDIGINKYSLDTDTLKKEVHEYLENLGIKDDRSAIAKLFDSTLVVVSLIFGGICGFLSLIGILINCVSKRAGYFSYDIGSREDGTFQHMVVPYDEAGFFVKYGFIIIPLSIFIMAMLIIICKYCYDRWNKGK